MMLTNLLSSAYMLHTEPISPKMTSRLEILNDCTVLSICNILICFTDFVGEAEAQHFAGYGYIGLAVGNMAIHVGFMTFK